MYPIKVRMIYKYLTRKKLIMLLLSQRGQPQKWYNQYGNVRCNTVCQLFNQPTNGGEKKNQKVCKQSWASSPALWILCVWLHVLSTCKYLDIQKLFPRPSGKAHLAWVSVEYSKRTGGFTMGRCTQNMTFVLWPWFVFLRTFVLFHQVNRNLTPL